MRWPLACLTHRYGRDGAGGGDDWKLRGSWCTARLAERLAEQFGAVSYGDPLMAAQLAVLLLPGTAAATQRAVWGTLAQDHALHLLPPTARCLGAPGDYCGKPGPGGRGGVRWEEGVTASIARALSAGDVDKALGMGSVTADVAVAAVMDAVCGAPAASGNGSGGAAAGEGDGGKQARDKGMALARSLVGSMRPQALAAAVRGALAQGWSKEEVGRALTHACMGDGKLVEKVKWTLS